jgi:hypothetical protein
MPKQKATAKFTRGSVKGKSDGTRLQPRFADKERGGAQRHETRQAKHRFW